MRKILIITYYWPPAGGSGVQRWLKFTKYLPEYNWEPVIFTPENPYSELTDEDLLNDISSDTEICKTPIWEPYSLKDRFFGKVEVNQGSGVITNKKSFKNQFFNWIRGNIFIPDPKVFWVRPSVRLLNNKIRNEGIEHIITTGPPHSMHLIGLHLKKLNSSLRWIADFRDPWSELDLLDEFHLSKFSRKRHKKLEREVLKKADLTLTVSESWLEDLRRLGARNAALITNGYDLDDFELKPKSHDKFIIGHYGLLNHLRNPIKLWQELNSLCEDNSDFDSKLEIHLSGNIDKEILAEFHSHYPFLKSKLKNLGYLSHSQVLQKYNDTDVLLLLLFNSKSGIGNYPGKLFEYFAAQKPILAFGPNNSDTKRLIAETNSGMYLSYGSDNIKKEVLRLYSGDFSLVSRGLDRFSRKQLTRKLSDLLNQL